MRTNVVFLLLDVTIIVGILDQLFVFRLVNFNARRVQRMLARYSCRNSVCPFVRLTHACSVTK